MQRIEQRLRRLERALPTRQATIELTDEVRAQSALELAAWRAEQQAAIDAWRLRYPDTVTVDVGAPENHGDGETPPPAYG
jgi:hypothetical protein